MSSITGSSEIFRSHTIRSGCGYCKFKSKYGWVCDCTISHMIGRSISANMSCPQFKRDREKMVR